MGLLHIGQPLSMDAAVSAVHTWHISANARMALEPHQHAAEVDRLHICRTCLTRRAGAAFPVSASVSATLSSRSDSSPLSSCTCVMRHAGTASVCTPRCRTSRLSCLFIVSNINGSPYSQAVLHFPPLQFGPAFSGPAFSGRTFSAPPIAYALCGAKRAINLSIAISFAFLLTFAIYDYVFATFAFATTPSPSPTVLSHITCSTRGAHAENVDVLHNPRHVVDLPGSARRRNSLHCLSLVDDVK